MLRKRYNIVIMGGDAGSPRQLKLPVWLPPLLAVAFVAAAVANVFLWKYYRDYSLAERSLQTATRDAGEQRAQLLALTGKLKGLETDLTRVHDFNARLRVMMNLDTEQAKTSTPMGGTDSGGFSSDYLPVHRQELLARKMHDFLKQLSTEARLEEVRQQEIIQTFRARQDYLSAVPSIWPADGWVSSDFGYRLSPFTGQKEFHKGLDISGSPGTPVCAPAAAKVTSSGDDGSYGQTVSLGHGLGISTRFSHLQKIMVKEGQTVQRGELIGYIGNTGRSTGPHLHYEIRLNGLPVNPTRYILN